MASIRNRRLIVGGALVAIAALAAWALAGGGRAKPTLGLFTTLPIYWAEAGEMSEMLSGQTRTGWARGELERRFDLMPLDTLAAPEQGGDPSLADFEYLLLAQPRALSPAENVALDDWVRAGGRALVFADPLLTVESRFPIGDRRRPQDVALLSPILARWGLEMRFDPAQGAGERTIATDLAPLPVNLSGTLHPLEGAPTTQEDCWIAYERVFARCSVGEGEVTVIADAALFEEGGEEDRRMRPEALEWLVESAFADDI